MTSQESAGPASDTPRTMAGECAVEVVGYIKRAGFNECESGCLRIIERYIRIALTAANARNKEQVADLELLSIEKGQLKERVAALEAEKAERVLEPWDLIEGLKKDRAAALSQWKAAEARCKQLEHDFDVQIKDAAVQFNRANALEAEKAQAVALAVEKCVKWLGDNGYPLKALHMQRALSPTITADVQAILNADPARIAASRREERLVALLKHTLLYEWNGQQLREDIAKEII